jgi:hypothetical protein
MYPDQVLALAFVVTVVWWLTTLSLPVSIGLIFFTAMFTVLGS